MKPKAIFFHARISGGCNVDSRVSINPDYGRKQFMEQLYLMLTSELYENANEIYIGLNGCTEDMNFVLGNIPPGIRVLWHGEKAESLLPTFLYMEEWVKTHPDWLVCFHHTKSITHPGSEFHQGWRRRLEHHVIRNWRKCVEDLESGNYDTVGSDWKSPETHPTMFYPHHETATPYWAGVFYWATVEYLSKMPSLPRAIGRRHHWFLPELWCGSGTRPRVLDYSDDKAVSMHYGSKKIIG